MTDEHDEHRERGRRWAWAAFFLVAIPVYILSIGPIEVFYNEFAPKDNRFLTHAVYVYAAPLRWLHESGALPQWYIDYIMWWHDS